MAQNLGHTTIAKTLAPSYQLMLVFNFGTAAALSRATMELTQGKEDQAKQSLNLNKCLVIGPVKQPLNYVLPPGAQILVVNFKADGFYRTFGKLPQSVTRITGAEEIIPAGCFSDLWQALSALPGYPDQTERVALLSAFCLPYIRQADPDVIKLKSSQRPQEDYIKATAFQTGKSTRHFQKLHKKHWGSSAKELQRFHRFVQALQILETYREQQAEKTKPDWFDIIVQCGYYDQSQLIHDFKYFVGLTPSQYIKFQDSICRSTI